jgi:ribonuclease R
MRNLVRRGPRPFSARKAEHAPRVHPRRSRSGLPEVAVILVTGIDPDGDAIAQPLDWEEEGPPPQILMGPEARGEPALAPGQRVLARLRPAGPGRYEGRTIRVLEGAPARLLGVFRPGARGEGRIEPTNRRIKSEWLVPPGESGGAQAGEIVIAEPLPQRGRHFGPRSARVIERLGRIDDARAVSMIAIATHDLPHVFPPQAVRAASRAKAVPLGKREDLRPLKLVTIDGEDARDFDDAVFAEPDPGGGFRLIVAIADVAHYVRPGTALDRAARERGNSTYFPDRVVPMLPEALSNGWCSLRPEEDRGCLFVDMRIDASGAKTGHRFGRGLMRSAARLTYEQVQAAHEAGDTLGLPLPTLYAVFRVLLDARTRRGTLDLDLPERKIVLDATGRVASVEPRPRLDSHRLIEEFMILANVAAAEELERRHAPCVYRVHAPPSPEKLEALRDFLKGLGISLPPGDQVRPRDLDRVLRRVAGTDSAPLVNEVVLRSQSQAAYGVDNIGHFGLALTRYAHFTSPIRRYADLLVHRSLVRALRLGPDGLSPDEAAALEETAGHVTATERRSLAAERDAADRYLAAFMADRVGANFRARVSGVTRYGIFVTLPENGASGIVPRSSLPDDLWRHDERAQTLTGRHTGLLFRLAQQVHVRLIEASSLTGGLVFQLVQGTPSSQDKGGKRRNRARSR